MTKRVLILMSDTGGGHRAAAEALRDTLYHRYGEAAVQVTLIDVFRQYTHFPTTHMPEIYPWVVNNFKWAWGAGYKLLDNRLAAWVSAQTLYYSNTRRLQQLYHDHPADVVVSVHSMLTRPTLNAFRAVYGDHPERPRYLTVVTDLVTTPAYWYDSRADRVFVPTPQAFERGERLGVPHEKLVITGLPVHPRFTDSPETQAEARAALGWDPELPAILMVAGSDGTGPVAETARAIDLQRLPCQLIVIAGRNTALHKKLSSASWHQPTEIYGYRTDMPRLMRAASILVTKAGPATLMEACASGLPPIISDAIPGQEDGNIIYLVEHNAGAFAPSPQRVARIVAQWVRGGPDTLRTLSERARALANPQAAEGIAQTIWECAQRHETTSGVSRVNGRA